jgi:predicted acyltransferase
MTGPALVSAPKRLLSLDVLRGLTIAFMIMVNNAGLLLFAFVYWAIEQRGSGKSGWSKRLLWPWLVFGSNAIVAYMISELLGTAIGLVRFTSGGHRDDALSYSYEQVFAPIGDPGWRAFAYAVSYTAVCFLPVWALYRRKIVVKV